MISLVLPYFITHILSIIPVFLILKPVFSFGKLSYLTLSRSPNTSFGSWKCSFIFPQINKCDTHWQRILCGMIYIYFCIINNYHFEPGFVTVIFPNVWHTLLLCIVITANVIKNMIHTPQLYCIPICIQHIQDSLTDKSVFFSNSFFSSTCFLFPIPVFMFIRYELVWLDTTWSNKIMKRIMTMIVSGKVVADPSHIGVG